MNSNEIVRNVASARRAYASELYDDAAVLYTAFSAEQYLADSNFDIEILFEVLLAIYMSEYFDHTDDYLQKIKSIAESTNNNILKIRYHIILGDIFQAKSCLQDAYDKADSIPKRNTG